MTDSNIENTTYYDLAKPGLAANADITVINGNMDKVDAALHKIEVEVGAVAPSPGESITPKIIPVANGGTGSGTASGARTNLGLGSVATESKVPLNKGGTNATDAAGARSNLGLGNLATLNSPLAVDKGGTGATGASGARTNLGLGSMATLSSPLPIANGGTGKTNATDARANLGLGTLATINSPLPIANGGTGKTTASEARANLGLGAAAVLSTPIGYNYGGTNSTTIENTTNTYNGITINMYKWGHIVMVNFWGTPTNNIAADNDLAYQNNKAWTPVTTVSFPVIVNGGQSVVRCETTDGKNFRLKDVSFSSKPSSIVGSCVYLTNY